jgi:hypothetical protein
MNENQLDGVKVCRLKLGNYSVMFEQEGVDESYDLQMLVDSNIDLYRP